MVNQFSTRETPKGSARKSKLKSIDREEVSWFYINTKCSLVP